MTVSVKDIDALLPQTQCGECSFAGCMPYAEAILQGNAAIDRCPPGGEQTVKALAQLLNRDAEPFLAKAKANTRAPSLAFIQESECVGCTKCIQACPVDAIIGSGKLMHTVIASECTGCGLCVEPCPIDCIEMHPLSQATYDKNRARQRFQAKQVRSLRDQHEQQQRYREKKKALQKNELKQEQEIKQDYILQALKRVNAKKRHG